MASPQPMADPTAVIGQRVGAFVVDGVVVLVPGMLLAATEFQTLHAPATGRTAAEYCSTYLSQYPNGTCVNVGDAVYFKDSVALASLAPLGIAILLFVIIQGLTGFTVGKLLFGLRTVKQDGSVVGIPRALLRWVLLIIDSLPCVGLVGLITAASTNGHRRVGDMAAKTYVVRRAAMGAPISVPGLATVNGTHGDMGRAGQGPGSSGISAPRWDPARNTYIQWDPEQSCWCQWNEATHTWDRIPGS